jgi:hypothetical protein
MKCNSIFGHRYKPVITRGVAEASDLGLKGCGPDDIVNILNTLRKETFNGVYCENCGHLLERINHE